MNAQTVTRYGRCFRLWFSPLQMQGCYFSPKVTQLPLLCIPVDRKQQHRNLWFSVGDKVSTTRKFTQEDVQLFADLSGDNNPIHVDVEYAKDSRFGQPVVHGILSNGLLSGLLGTKLPGPGSILLEMDIKYTAPLYVGEEVRAVVEVIEITHRRATFSLLCEEPVSKRVVLTGAAKLLIPKEKPPST